jgi:hypothetical protein
MSIPNTFAGPRARVVVRSSLRKTAILLAAVAAASLLGSVSLAATSPRTHYCGYIAFGKGWYLHGSRNVSCRTARRVFDRFYKKPACYSSCTVPPYHCQSSFNSRADVGRVRCSADRNRLVKWHSNH